MTTPADPLTRFRLAQAEACATEPLDATAVVLATVDAQGQPSARVVLLKNADERGFVFYTNFESKKGRELGETPKAALCFHWASRTEQVRVEGRVERVSDEEADAYFATRPRASQIGAWASRQSEPLESRDVLMAAVSDVERRFADADVPRPAGWGGFRLIPDRIEFWFGRDDRLHDRELYVRTATGWDWMRLFP
jgi:pyridoxamine 5'-phosphate oxidase